MYKRQVFPNVDGAEKIQKSIAEQFVKADSVLNGNYDYSYFDYAQMKGMVNNIPLQQDAAGGHAYVLLLSLIHIYTGWQETLAVSPCTVEGTTETCTVPLQNISGDK